MKASELIESTGLDSGLYDTLYRDFERLKKQLEENGNKCGLSFFEYCVITYLNSSETLLQGIYDKLE